MSGATDDGRFWLELFGLVSSAKCNFLPTGKEGMVLKSGHQLVHTEENIEG